MKKFKPKNEFEKINHEVNAALQPFMRHLQDGHSENMMQDAVNRVFLARARQRRPVVLEGTGMQIVGCKLKFGIGVIGCDYWKTAFHLHSVHTLFKAKNPTGYALGFHYGTQLWIDEGPDGDYLHCSLPNAPDAKMRADAPTVPGTAFHIAQQRAMVLGFVKAVNQQYDSTTIPVPPELESKS